jgi:hypothetical protein
LRALVGHAVISGAAPDATMVQALCSSLEPSLSRLSSPCNTVRAALAQLLSLLAPMAPSECLHTIAAKVEAAARADWRSPHDFTNVLCAADAARWRTELHCLHLRLVGPHDEAAAVAIIEQMIACADCDEVRLAGVLHARAALGLGASDVDDGVPIVRRPSERSAWRMPEARRPAVGRLLVSVVEGRLASIDGSRACALHALQLLCDRPELVEPALRGRAQHAALELYQHAHDHELRSLALHYASVGGRADETYTAEAWAHDLEAAASEDKPVSLRVAAAHAVGSASALRTRGPATILLWLLAIRLLEDDDPDVRDAMASALSPLVAPGAVGALLPSVVRQLGWIRLAQTFPASELRKAAERALTHDRPLAAPDQPSFAVFPAEALNFYREPSVETATVAFLTGDLMGEQGELPLGWAQPMDLGCLAGPGG